MSENMLVPLQKKKLVHIDKILKSLKTAQNVYFQSYLHRQPKKEAKFFSVAEFVLDHQLFKLLLEILTNLNACLYSWSTASQTKAGYNSYIQYFLHRIKEIGLFMAFQVY